MTNILSDDVNRNRRYLAFLEDCRQHKATLPQAIELGYDVMRKAKIHHHFFLDRSFRTTARHLVYHLLKHTPDRLTTSLNEAQGLAIVRLFERRIADRIPVEYLTHEAYYLGYSFYVDENVLIPRSIMNTRFQDFLADISWSNRRVLDLCTGSGCIGISLALLDPSLTVDLSDLSEKALAVANTNIQRYHLQHRVQCIHSDLFQNITHTYDLIITNPPYIATKEYDAAPPEFKKEPKIALEAGKQGTDIIKSILEQAKSYLNPHGMLIAEVGTSAAKILKKEYPHIRFTWLKYRPVTGKTAWLAEPGIFLCHQDDL